MSEKAVSLARRFAVASAECETPDGFYPALDLDGWLIEFARAHLRLESRAALSHLAWAGALGFDGARPDRAYRAAVLRPGPIRAALVDLARSALKLRGPEALRLALNSGEYRLWLAAKDGDLRRPPSRPGRPLTAIPANGPMGRRLEERRLALDLSIGAWAGKLGLGPGTYRRYLRLERRSMNLRLDPFLAALDKRSAQLMYEMRAAEKTSTEQALAASSAEVRAAAERIYAAHKELRADEAQQFASLKPSEFLGDSGNGGAPGSVTYTDPYEVEDDG